MKMEQVISTDGTKIAFWRRGTGDPLLFIHGTAESSEDWGELPAVLESDFTVAVMDRRGRGQSGDGEEYSLDLEAGDVAAVVDALGGKAHIMARSFGARVALEAAMREVDIQSLILFEPIHTSRYMPADLPSRIEEFLHASEVAAACELFFSESGLLAPEDVISWLNSLHGPWTKRTRHAETIPREIREIRNGLVSLKEALVIEAPVLLLTGGELPSKLVLKGLKKLEPVLPNARRESIPGQSYMAVQDAPVLVAKHMLSFLLEQQGRTALEQQTRAKENKNILATFIDQIWNEGRLDKLDDYLTDDYVEHTAFGDFQGADEFRAFVVTMHRAFPDFQCRVDAVTGDADQVACRYTAQGTHDGEFMGILPTGNHTVIEGCIFGRIEDGKLAETWDQFDILSILDSLEVLPEDSVERMEGGPASPTS